MAIALGTNPHLTFSNWLFDEYGGAQWVVNPPRKLGSVLAAGTPWEQTWIGAWGNVEADGVDGYAYNAWYQASAWTGSDSSNVIWLALAHSNDGRRWVRPQYTYVNPRNRSGSSGRGNNLLQVGSRYVFKDTYPSVPGGQLYKTFGSTGSPTTMPVIQYGSDGKAWTPNGVAPFSGVMFDSFNQLHYEPNVGKYVVYGRGWTSTTDRIVVRFEVPVANILQNWDSAGIIQAGWKSSVGGNTVFNATIAALQQSAANYDLYNPCYVRYGDDAHLMFPSVYDHTSDLHNIHMAVSTDGITWSYPDGDGLARGYIERGNTNEEDCGTIYAWPGYVPSADGTKLYQYYSATTFKHNDGASVHITGRNWVSLCAVEQRMDGFVAMRARGAAQNWLTKQITFGGSALVLNADARFGRIRTALCDSAGTPITGFTLADSNPIEARDGVALGVSWAGNPNLAAYAGATVRLLFEADTCDVFKVKFN